MNKEEQKAIEWLKAQRGKYYKTTIDYISKLEKENKELKEMLKNRIKYTNELEQDLFENANNYVVSKDKIIELKEEWNKGIYWNNADDKYYAVKGLEGLLKEN